MLWRTRFERINFGFDPVLYQMADVVFECDVEERTDNTVVQLAEAAWEALGDQQSFSESFDGPIKDHSGWSSVMGGYPGSKYYKVNTATEDMASKQFPRRRSDD